MIEHIPWWAPLVAYAAGYGVGELQHWIRKHLRSMGPPRGSYGPRRRPPGSYIYNPVQIAECGGPCSSGPEYCDCGALWLDVPQRLTKPQPHGGRLIGEDLLP